MPERRPEARAQISGLIFAVLLLDSDGNIVEANHAAEDLLGHSAQRLIGMALRRVVDISQSGVVERLQDHDRQLVARGIAVKIGGHSHTLNLTASPIATHPGWRVVTLSQAGQGDMKVAEEPASSLKAPAVLAHEIKNPLAAIRGASQLAARKLAHKDQSLTTIITNEVDRIAELIDRMQELGSKGAEPVEAVNLHQCVRSATASVRAARSDSVTFSEEFDPSLPEVAASTASLEQILINLLTNAVDACSSQQNPKVTVRTRFVSGLATSASQNNPSVALPIELSVIDNGPGFEAGLVDHVFEPFVTSKQNGQGLGLALVKKLANDMGARTNCERDDVAGETTFRLHLAIAGRKNP